MSIEDYGRSLPPERMSLTKWALFWGTLYGISVAPGVDLTLLREEVMNSRSMYLAELFRMLEPGEIIQPSSLRAQLAHIEIDDAIAGAVADGVLAPVYRLSDAEAWTTDLVS